MTATLRPRRTVAPPASRILAAAIDLAMIGLAPLAVALSVAERFRLVAPGVGPGRLTPSDQLRIDELERGFSRAVEVDGWLYVVDGGGWLAILAGALAAMVVTQVVFPLVTGGRSPGKGLVGLRVIAADGRPATASQHLLRTLAGPVDLLPLIVPGLLGAGLAWLDPGRRRLGDRLAGTVVTTMPQEWVLRAAGPDSTDRSADRGLSAEPAGIGSGDGDPTGPPSGWDRAASRREPAPCAPARPAPTRTAPTRPAPTRPAPAGTGTPGTDAPAPPLPPVRRLDGSATRSPRSQRAATRAEIEVVERRPSIAPSEIWLGAEDDYQEWDGDPGPRSGHRMTQTGQPVPFDTLVLPESSLAEGADVTTVDTTDHGPDRPRWDPDHRAWVYRDRSSGRWYRHDAATIRWYPIDLGRRDGTASIGADQRSDRGATSPSCS